MEQYIHCNKCKKPIPKESTTCKWCGFSIIRAKKNRKVMLVVPVVVLCLALTIINVLSTRKKQIAEAAAAVEVQKNSFTLCSKYYSYFHSMPVSPENAAIICNCIHFKARKMGISQELLKYDFEQHLINPYYSTSDSTLEQLKDSCWWATMTIK